MHLIPALEKLVTLVLLCHHSSTSPFIIAIPFHESRQNDVFPVAILHRRRVLEHLSGRQCLRLLFVPVHAIAHPS